MFDDPRWGDARDRDDPRDFSEGRDGGDLRNWREDARELSPPDTRDRDRDRSDIRDAFIRDLDLPRGLERERVVERDREYTIRGSESRTLSTVGAFRVVSSRDLLDHHGGPADPRGGDLRHLVREGLVDTVRLDGRRDVAVALTDRGRDLLESHRRDPRREPRQAYYAGLKKPRELEHDVQLHRAYLRAAERLMERQARVRRLVLDYELKREYQRFLQERNRGRADGTGRPERDASEVRQWAEDHRLPYFDGRVHFPDARIEYEERDGRVRTEDIEVTTVHYRGAHGAACARSGFTRYGGLSARIGGRGGARSGGRSPDPRLAEELLR